MSCDNFETLKKMDSIIQESKSKKELCATISLYSSFEAERLYTLLILRNAYSSVLYNKQWDAHEGTSYFISVFF